LDENTEVLEKHPKHEKQFPCIWE